MEIVAIKEFMLTTVGTYHLPLTSFFPFASEFFFLSTKHHCMDSYVKSLRRFEIFESSTKASTATYYYFLSTALQYVIIVIGNTSSRHSYCGLLVHAPHKSQQ